MCHHAEQCKGGRRAGKGCNGGGKRWELGRSGPGGVWDHLYQCPQYPILLSWPDSLTEINSDLCQQYHWHRFGLTECTGKKGVPSGKKSNVPYSKEIFHLLKSLARWSVATPTLLYWCREIYWIICMHEFQSYFRFIKTDHINERS